MGKGIKPLIHTINFKNLYNDICAYVKQNFAFFASGFLCLLVGSCFIKEFALILIAYLTVLSLFSSVETILCFIAFLVPFPILFKVGFKYNFEEVYRFLLAMIATLKVSLSLWCERRAPNKILLIVLLSFFIYILLPMHIVSLKTAIRYSTALMIVFASYENRNKLSTTKLVYSFCLGLMISSILCVFEPISERLQEMISHIKVASHIRFSGLTAHPNILAQNCTVAFCSVFLIFLLKKIKPVQFLQLFVIIYLIGISTLSRNYILSMFIGLALFIMAYIVLYKKKSLRFLTAFIFTLAAFSLCMFPEIKFLFSRVGRSFDDMVYENVENIGAYNFEDQNIQHSLFSNNITYHKINIAYAASQSGVNKSEGQSQEEWWDDVVNGRVRYDPGRKEIAKNYLKNWASSPLYILFGRGVSAPRIGQMSAHNFWIQELWLHGLVGYIFYFCLIFSMLRSKKKLRFNFKKCLLLSVFFAPVLFMSLLEACSLDLVFYILAISLLLRDDLFNNLNKKIK